MKMQIKFVVSFLFLILPHLVWTQTLAILDFQDKSLPPSVVAPAVLRKLFTDLFPPEEFTIIDRDLIQRILPPKTQEAIGEITPSMANILGQILGADILVTGSYQEISGDGSIKEGSLFISASFIDTGRSTLSGISRQIMDLYESVFSREGLVEAVTDRVIILNIGSFHGVQIGDRFIVIRSGYVVGEVKISRVERYMSEALVISKEGVAQVGDIVRKSPFGPTIATPTQALIIDSTPSGMRCSINGNPMGITPLILYEPAAGVHTITIEGGEDYDRLEEKILIEEKKPSSFLKVNLLLARLREKGLPSAKASTIIVSSIPTNAKVYLNGKLKGVSPLTLDNLPAGLFRVRVAKAGYGSVEQEVVLKEQEIRRLNIILSPILSLEAKKVSRARPIPPPPQLLRVQTPYSQYKGGWYLSLRYPEIFSARFGLFLQGLEFRLQGLGLGIKYQFDKAREKRVALDFFLRRYKAKTSLDLRGIFGTPFDSGFGLMNLVAGIRYRLDERFHFFGGFDNYLTPRLQLLGEYDTLDGWAVGIRYDLPKNLKFAIGLGREIDGTPRLDAYLSLQR